MFNLHAESLSHGLASAWTSLRSHPQEVGRLPVQLANAVICSNACDQPANPSSDVRLAFTLYLGSRTRTISIMAHCSKGALWQFLHRS